MIPHADQDFGEIVNGWFAAADAILLGRTTYDLMSSYWTQVTDPDNPVGVALNGQPKYVVSSTLSNPEWQHTTVLSGDPIEEVTRLKEQGGDGELQVHGSAQLARSVHEAGIVDEYRLLVVPVCVGAGKRLFSEAAPATGFELVNSRTTSVGAQYCVLRPTTFEAGLAEVVDGREKV